MNDCSRHERAERTCRHIADEVCIAASEEVGIAEEVGIPDEVSIAEEVGIT